MPAICARPIVGQLVFSRQRDFLQDSLVDLSSKRDRFGTWSERHRHHGGDCDSFYWIVSRLLAKRKNLLVSLVIGMPSDNPTGKRRRSSSMR